MAKTPREIRAALEAMEVTPRKSRGQNYLCDRGVIDKIVRFAGITKADTVIEIGPGLGALTDELVAAAGRYTAVELEPKCQAHLLDTCPGLTPEQIVIADVRTISLPDERFGTPPYVVVSNVPYSLSSEITLWLLKHRGCVTRASFLLQREFAERLAAVPGSKVYGSLTVLRTLFADAQLGPIIPGTVFLPPAEVESRLIELRMLPEPRFPVASVPLFERVVRAAFSTRRKTLLNALSGSTLGFEKSVVRELLHDAGVDEGRRAETLSLEEFSWLVAKVAERVGDKE